MDPCGRCAVGLTARFAFGDYVGARSASPPSRGGGASSPEIRAEHVRSARGRIPRAFPAGRRKHRAASRDAWREWIGTGDDAAHQRIGLPCLARLTVCRGVLGPEPGDLPGAGYPKLRECNRTADRQSKARSTARAIISTIVQARPDRNRRKLTRRLWTSGNRGRPENSGRDADEATV